MSAPKKKKKDFLVLSLLEMLLRLCKNKAEKTDSAELHSFSQLGQVLCVINDQPKLDVGDYSVKWK